MARLVYRSTLKSSSFCRNSSAFFFTEDSKTCLSAYNNVRSSRSEYARNSDHGAQSLCERLSRSKDTGTLAELGACNMSSVSVDLGCKNQKSRLRETRGFVCESVSVSVSVCVCVTCSELAL